MVLTSIHGRGFLAAPYLLAIPGGARDAYAHIKPGKQSPEEFFHVQASS